MKFCISLLLILLINNLDDVVSFFVNNYCHRNDVYLIVGRLPSISKLFSNRFGGTNEDQDKDIFTDEVYDNFYDDFDPSFDYEEDNQGDNPKSNDNSKPKFTYNMSRDAGPNISSITEEKIQRLLAKRLIFKLDNDYENADTIQAELLSAGVLIHDKTNEWRADGKYFANFTPRQYMPSSQSTHSSENLNDIEKLIAERAQTRAERLFKRSDVIRTDLLDRFDVHINDKLLIWSVGGGGLFGDEKKGGNKYLPYAISKRSVVPKNTDDIQNLVQKRDIARVSREFKKADTIRSQLLENDIMIDDKKREWYVKSHNRINDSNKVTQKDIPPFIRRGSGNFSLEELNKIENLVNERDSFKRKKQYKEADDIRSELLRSFDISVDDWNREWYLISEDYGEAHDSAEIDETTRNLVQQKVKERTLAREEKNFDAADSIKSELAKEYNVAIDDRKKEWSIIYKENELL
ncbi:MAG: cysteinyl-tRNA synthetase [Bacillariaceae sp.]|jgi:cysteinyl-tRNA synthetase